MAGLRSRSSLGKKVFLISAIEEQQRKDLARKIHLLGGKYFDLQNFKAICTHVICGKLSHSEKFLGACATGKWVLHPDYVYDSAEAGAWLDEEQYEWCDEHIARRYPADENLAFAPRRWRFMLGDSSTAFSGWKVAVIAGNKKSKVIKRLLMSGGAEIYNIKIPVRNPAKVADTISYIFVSEQNMRSVISLVDYGVMCLKPEFIGDYLILDPQPDQMDYLVQVADTQELGSQEDLASSQNSFLLDSQRSAYISPVKASSSATPDFSPLSASSSGTPGTPGSSIAGTGLNHGPLSQSTPNGLSIPSTSRQSTSYLLYMSGKQKAGSSKEQGTFQGYNYVSHNVGAGEYDKENLKDISVMNEDNGILEMEKLLSVNSSVAKSSIKTVKLEVSTPDNETSKKSETVKNNEYQNLDEIRQKVKQNLEESDRSFSASQGPKISSPVRRLSKKQLHSGMNLSPITKFFKPQPLETLSQPVTSLTTRLMNKSATSVNPLSVIQPMATLTTPPANMSATSPSVSQLVTPGTPPLVNTSVTPLSFGKTVITSLAVEQSNAMKSPEPLKTPESLKQLLSCSQPSVNRELESPGTPLMSRVVELKVPSKMKTSDSKEAPVYVKRSVSLIIPSPNKPNTQSAASVDNSLTLNTTTSLNTPSSIKEQQTSAAVRVSPQTEEKENSPTMPVEMFYKRTVNSQAESQSLSCSEERQLALERTPEKRQIFTKFEKQDRKRKSTEMDPDSISPGSAKRRTRSSPGGPEIMSPEKDSYIFTTLSPSPRKKNIATPLLSAVGHTPNVTSETIYRRTGLKKKLDEDEHLRNIVEDVKRGKLNSGDWYSTMFTANLREDEDVPESVPMQLAATSMITATLEDNFTLEGIIQIRSHISFRYHPSSVIISQLMRNVLQGKEDDERDAVGETVANLAYTTLCTVLKLHPPITEVLQGVYLEALAGTGSKEESKADAEWSFIEDCVSEVLCSDDEGYTRNNLLLFKFILQMLEQNFMYFVGTNKQKESKIKHMLFRMFWGPSYYISFNTRCRSMMNVLSDALQAFLSAQEVKRKQVLCEVLLGVLSIVAMVTESCRVVECGNMEPLKALQGISTSVFVHEISKQLRDIRGQQLLHTVISGLRIPWLIIGVCQQLLMTFDDYLLPEDPIQLNIVTQYFYMLPQLDGVRKCPQSSAQIRTKLTTRNPATITFCLTENTDINKANLSQQTKKANKRNHKGETPLHLACIRNNVAKVKELLQTPGIDVNAKDNAEWTPLHEACNHGNLECVKELLKFVPCKTVDIFFNKEVKGSRKVDLLARNSEGITPLHDAVINNRLEVCRLLLHHGGLKLLEARTTNGFYPADLAETHEMASLLTSFSHSKRKVSESQEVLTSTQDSVSSTEELLPFSPSEALYQEVLYANGTRVYANTKSLVYYIRLVTALVTHYIKASHLDLVTLCLRDNTLPGSLFVKDLDLVNNDQGESSMSPVLESRKDLQHKDLHCKMLFPVTQVSTETPVENPKCQTSYYNGCNQSNSSTNLYRNGCASMSTNKRIEANTEGKITDLTELKKELKLFGSIAQHVNRFRTHLLKIAREEDMTIVERELCHLCFVTEGL